MIFKVS